LTTKVNSNFAQKSAPFFVTFAHRQQKSSKIFHKNPSFLLCKIHKTLRPPKDKSNKDSRHFSSIFILAKQKEKEYYKHSYKSHIHRKKGEYAY
jgi:hypothetical protein